MLDVNGLAETNGEYGYLTAVSAHYAFKERHMSKEPKHMMDEPDIGSGEKTPAQEEIEQEARTVKAPPVHPQNGSQLGREVIEEQQYADRRPSAEEQKPRHASQHSALPGRILQSGDHIARIATVELPDHTFEAQVYVRLSREPEVAETYIPAGAYATEAEAWIAAEERANRAFKEHEF
jgi:hypothetical protein